MQKHFLAIVCLFIATLAKGQQFNWAYMLGSNSMDEGRVITTDASGFIYTAGHFLETIDFDPGPLTDNHTATGLSHSIFIQKLNPAGNVIWTKTIAGDSANVIYDIKPDHSGNIYLLGEFKGKVDFDLSEKEAFYTAKGAYNFFLQKLDKDGKLVWVNVIEGNTSIIPARIAFDTKNNSYITGMYSGQIDFNAGPDTNYHHSNGKHDVFLLKLNVSGQYLWSKSWGGFDEEEIKALAIDHSDNIYLPINFSHVVDADPGPNVHSLTSVAADYLMVKLDENGNFLHAIQSGGDRNEYTASVAIGSNDEIYVAGTFDGTADFDPDTSTDFHTSVGQEDVFVQKLDDEGGFIWARAWGGSENETISTILTAENGTIYSAGNFEAPVDFDPGILTDIHDPSGRNGIFSSVLDSSGNYLRTNVVNSSFYGVAEDAALDIAGNLYLTGSFGGDLRPDKEHSNTIYGKGMLDIFLAQFCMPSYSSIIETACGSYVSPSGRYEWTSSGTYEDTTSSSIGCDSILKIQLTINTVDTSVLIAGNMIVANAGNASYQWLYCGSNKAVPNETNQSFIPKYKGYYKVVVTQNGCSDTGNCYFIDITGIRNKLNHQAARVYPNPASEQVQITLPEIFSDMEVLVTNPLGQAISKTYFSNTAGFQVTLSGSKGIYLIRLSDSKGNVTHLKVLKQ